MKLDSLNTIGGSDTAGASYPPLVAPTITEGTIQREADGTTSATITVGAASGGSGSYTYSMGTLNKPGGDGALLSAGTPPRTYNLTSMSDGGTYVISGTVTDDVTGQVVSWSHTVVVAAPADFSDPTATGVTRSLPAGTTSTTYTIVAPSEGGESPLSWARALVHDNGSGASVSGSDTGLQTVSNLEDEDMVTITHTATDDAGRDRVFTVSFSVRKAAASNGWQVISGSALDWTGLDSATLTDNALQWVQKSTVNFVQVYVYQAGGMNGSVSAGSAGLSLVSATSGSGRRSVSWDTSSDIGSGTLTADDWKGTKAFQMLLTGMAFNGSGERLAAGLGEDTDFIGSGDVACAYWSDNGADVDVGVYTDGLTAAVVHAGETTPTACLVSVIMHDGLLSRVEITNGASAFAMPQQGSETYDDMTAGTSVSAGAVPVQLATVRAGMAHFQETGATLTDSRWVELVP